MKKDVLLLPLSIHLLSLLEVHPEWVKDYEERTDKLRYLFAILENVIIDTINERLEHTELLNSMFLLDRPVQHYIDLDVLSFLPEIRKLYDFMEEGEWNMYEVLYQKGTLVIIKGMDWRIKEYYRLTDQAHEEEIDVWLEGWSEDQAVTQRFLKSSYAPKDPIKRN